ncbi:SIR2 family protein [Leptospira barantonii]|uniref:SIR2-like domain-containing protein n=1 Tax=Leptospira barantonii TaxID=2023184 RepID=A0ABX4NR48_9LEPT|nr:SIR2 family protein [Leptospira barantonii]PJZ57468.1 hypothetical protein CH367_08935 [Leptospira barantonii]
MNQIFNNNNVYVLGAGFSKDANMPLTKDFLIRMREAAEWLETNEDSRSIKHIRDVFDFRLKASGAAYRVNINIEDIEQLFSLAAAKEIYSFNEAIVESIAATLNYCEKTGDRKNIDLTISKEFANKIPKANLKTNNLSDTYSSDSYDFYIGNMLGLFKKNNVVTNNTFISFNYDTVLENSIWNLGHKVSYGIKGIDAPSELHDSDSGIKVLKLHGSINWKLKPNSSGLFIQAFRNYDDSSKSKGDRILLPPTWQKTFSGHLQYVWNNAISAISTATRLIIIGFSIPETDIHFKYLLSAGLQDNISLREILFVNPMEEDEFTDKAKKIFHSSFLETGIVRHVKSTASEYLKQYNHLDRINRRPDL